jgi:hypothetical protein
MAEGLTALFSNCSHFAHAMRGRLFHRRTIDAEGRDDNERDE